MQLESVFASSQEGARVVLARANTSPQNRTF